MTDTMTPEQRHRCMSHIHSKGTKPELKVRRWLWGHGYRYRLNMKSVPGKPDIVLRTYRTAIFVNGCFWHGHGVAEPPVESLELKVNSLESVESGGLASSKCCKIPNTNREFWVRKIRRNQERDCENYRVLQENGWHVIVVWECQLTPRRIERTMREVELLLNDNMLSRYRRPKPTAYTTNEEEAPLPLAAEDATEWKD
jgi:DNA mismatch endonuclease (patch repair protein)